MGGRLTKFTIYLSASPPSLPRSGRSRVRRRRRRDEEEGEFEVSYCLAHAGWPPTGPETFPRPSTPPAAPSWPTAPRPAPRRLELDELREQTHARPRPRGLLLVRQAAAGQAGGRAGQRLGTGGRCPIQSVASSQPASQAPQACPPACLIRDPSWPVSDDGLRAVCATAVIN